jgi:nicotinamide-nucleotide amidase
MTGPAKAPVRQQVELLLGELLRRARWQLGVAESLTGGQLAAGISEGPRASEWFKGGVVAYQPATKRKLLGVSDGPVVAERCALEMTKGVSTLLEAEVGLALTGVGGPGPAEGHAPGTVGTTSRPLSTSTVADSTSTLKPTEFPEAPLLKVQFARS